MKLFTDIGNFLKSLTFVDYVFFIAVMVLMILIVTLYYFIKINSERELFKENVEDEDLEKTAEMKIVEEITKNIDTEESYNIDFTEYEKEQENKAIISYDELLNRHKSSGINYEKEEKLDDLTIKKVNLDNLESFKDNDAPKMGVRVISYAEEEAFLMALKQLLKEIS